MKGLNVEIIILTYHLLVLLKTLAERYAAMFCDLFVNPPCVSFSGMYFQVREFVQGCEECHLRQTKKAEVSRFV